MGFFELALFLVIGDLTAYDGPNGLDELVDLNQPEILRPISIFVFLHPTNTAEDVLEELAQCQSGNLLRRQLQ